MLKSHLKTIPLAFLLLALAGCSTTAHFPENLPLEQAGVRHYQPPGLTKRNDILLILTFSGGGSRASALSYGILETLAEVPLTENGERHLVDEVDLISSVSGGSITAAYYGLYGDRLFSDFKSRFLDQDIESQLKSVILSPSTLSKLGSDTFGSGDVLDDFFRDKLFDDATLDQLFDNDGPQVQINATDLFKGSRFGFTPDQFSLICSDTNAFPVSRAVAASCAVPILFAPVTLANRAGMCGYVPQPWFYQAMLEDDTNIRRHQLAQRIDTYLDQKDHPYIHLLDGGLSDNLGVRAIIDHLVQEGGVWNTLKRYGHHKAKHIVMIVVDAASVPPSKWEMYDTNPPDSAILDAATTVPLANYNFETMEYLRNNIPAWREEVTTGQCREMSNCIPKPFYMIEISLNNLHDEATRKALTQIPTGFTLPKGAADQLIDAAHQMLNANPEFQRLLQNLHVSTE